MRIQLKNLVGLDGTTPTFAQTYGISFEQGVEWAQEGVALAEQGRADEACVILEGLVTLNPRSPSYWYALGFIYEKQELTEDAIQAYTMATERDRRHTEGWLRLGLLQLKKGDGRGIDSLRMAVKDTRAENAEFVARAKSILATSRAA